MTDLLDDDALLDLRRRAKATDPAAVLAEERSQRESAARRARTSDATSLSGREGPAHGGFTGGSLASGSPQAGATPSPATGPGLCATCGQRPARDACTACGRPTCAADLWIMLRLCRQCASDADVARGQRGARPEGSNWLRGGRT